MQISKTKSYIGFAVRKNSVIYGLESIKRARRKIYVVLKDASLGGCAARAIAAYCTNHNAVLIETPFLLNDLLKREKVKLIGITDESLSVAIINSSNVTEVEDEQ